jgi:hypothetical protein
MEPGGHSRSALLNTLVVASLGDESIIVCARPHAHGSVPVRPEAEVAPGTVVA